MGLLQSLRTSASALSAQRLRMDVIANNIANMNTTRTEQGGPYQREVVTFAERTKGPSFLSALRSASGRDIDAGVQVSAVLEDGSPPRRAYEPEHPDADAEGWVLYPNVNVVTEMTDLISAGRAYDANITVLNATKSMALRALDMFRR